MVDYLIYVALFVLLVPTLALLSLRFGVLPFLRKTYFFWCAVSLVNFSFLAFLVFPPLLLVIHMRFASFLLPPIGVAAAVVLLLVGFSFLVNRRKQLSPKVIALAPYAVNLVFLLAFLWSADAYKSYLIQKALAGRTPDCVYVNSFFESVRAAGEEFQFFAHAVFVEEGKNFYWSYSDLAFFAGNDQLDPNFPCPAR